MMIFTITFHGPFRVGTGTPSEGLDARVDRDVLLPSTSLKGVMRAAASETLRLPDRLVSEVFGQGSGGVASGTGGAPWGWSDAEFATPAITPVTRIRIDDATGLTQRGALMMGEHVWASTASFTVFPLTLLADPARLTLHSRVLRASARAVTSLGGLRRRGEGWVSITDDQPLTTSDVEALLAEVRA